MLSHLRQLALMAVVLGVASGVYAQGQQDFSAVQIELHHVIGNIYYLEGGQGSNIGLLVGDDGVLMIDAQFAPLTEKVVAVIRTLSDKPIRMLVNTHVHGDHTGGNINFGAMGIDILAHDNVRVRLAKGVNGGAPSPAAALPFVTFGDSMSLHLNGERINVVKLPPAHTDGDSYIHFAAADVIHAGDVFPRRVGYPAVDLNNGGTVQGTIDAVQAMIDVAGPNTKIIPGHGVVSTRADLIVYRDKMIELQKRVSPLVRQGMTLEQVMAARPTAGLDDAEYGSPERFMPGYYDALKAEL